MDLLPLAMIHTPIVELVCKEHPDLPDDALICLNDLNRFRIAYVESLLATEKGELSSLDAAVIRSLRAQDLLAKNVSAEFDRHLTLGQRVADAVARFGGSWGFILSFGAALIIWIMLNAVILAARPFDPYPFILLNLVLSCIAALQAPVIMMSQNRQEAKDRLRAEHDYEVNLKAELEIRHLHEKMDHLLRHQWERLVEIQQIQMELMDELTAKATELRR